MHTVLGANGQIAEELTDYLFDNITHDIRLVSRNPRKVHETDQLVKANLMDADATAAAVAGSEIAYLTVGLPLDSTLWEQQFPVMMANTIAACRQHGTKLVFFDNTYMYPRTDTPQVETTAFQPVGRKATVRARIATMLLEEMDAGRIEAQSRDMRDRRLLGLGQRAERIRQLVHPRRLLGAVDLNRRRCDLDRVGHDVRLPVPSGTRRGNTTTE